MIVSTFEESDEGAVWDRVSAAEAEERGRIQKVAVNKGTVHKKSKLTSRIERNFKFISFCERSIVDTRSLGAIVSHKAVCYIQPRHAGVNN